MPELVVMILRKLIPPGGVGKTLILFVVMHLLPAGFIGDAAAQDELRKKEIIAFGDSITVGLPEQEIDPAGGLRIGGYEPDLEALTDGRNDHYDVFNFGDGGEVTAEGIQRFRNELAKHPQAEYVLILEGTNDIWAEISREDTVWNLAAMVDKARDAGIEPILGTLTPDPRDNGKNVPLYNRMIKEMAVEKNVVVADLYAEMVDDWETTYIDILYPDVPSWNDWLHPNRAGYAKMAEVWFAAVFSCARGYLDQCRTGPECSASGGYWYNDTCNFDPAAAGGMLMLLLNTSGSE